MFVWKSFIVSNENSGVVFIFLIFVCSLSFSLAGLNIFSFSLGLNDMISMCLGVGGVCDCVYMSVHVCVCVVVNVRGVCLHSIYTHMFVCFSELF